MSETERVRTRLSHYSSLQKDLKELEDSGHLQKLTSVIKDILSTHKAKPDFLNFKENLKAIIDSVIKETSVTSVVSPSLSRISQKSHRSNHSQMSLKSLSPPQKYSQNHSLRELFSASKQSSLLRSHKSRENSEDLSYMSGFCTIRGAATFSKQSKFQKVKRELSPGPADYNADPAVYKKNSPRILIPSSGKRFEFHNNFTPAPNAYYPLWRNLAKKSQ